MDIELAAVTAVNSVISLCPHLDSHIETKDKIPFTDGYIALYADAGKHGKEYFCGKVDVQVKGRTKRKGRGWSSKADVSRKDLEGYKKTGGVIYFWVEVDNKSQQRHVSYALLSPFRIQELLQQGGNREKYRIRVKGFPTVTAEIEAVVELAIRKTRECPNNGIDPALLQKAKTLTLYTDRHIDFSKPVVLDQSDVDYSLDLSTGKMTVPLNGRVEFLPEAYVSHPLGESIMCGGTLYENPAIKQLDEHRVMIELSPALSMTLESESESSTISSTISRKGTLYDCVKAAAFLSSLIQTSTIQRGDLSFHVDSAEKNVSAGLKSYLEKNREYGELFKTLEIDTALVDAISVTDAHELALQRMYAALVMGEELPIETHEPSRMRQSLGEWWVSLLVLDGSDMKHWKSMDFFDPRMPRQLIWRPDENRRELGFKRITPYDVVGQDELSRTLNLHLGQLVSAYQEVRDYDREFTRSNRTVLNLIQSADDVERRSKEFLHAAMLLNEWIIAEHGEKSHHLVNRWQIKARGRDLTDDDMEMIRELRRDVARRDSEDAEKIQIGCALLLGEGREADFLMKKLSKADYEEITGWPVWNLRTRCLN